MNVLSRAVLIVCGLTGWAAAAVAECETFRILESTGISFGDIAVAAHLGGVVVVSPGGAVATLGDVGSAGGAQPGFIRICGPANAEFRLVFSDSELDLTRDAYKQRPHVVRNLEIVARGARIHPTGPGEWTGTLGGRGEAALSVGATLTIPAFKVLARLAADFRIAIMAAD